MRRIDHIGGEEYRKTLTKKKHVGAFWREEESDESSKHFHILETVCEKEFCNAYSRELSSKKKKKHQHTLGSNGLDCSGVLFKS